MYTLRNQYLAFILVIAVCWGCSEPPTRPPILAKPPIINEHRTWAELGENGDSFIVGFYYHLEIIPQQVMYDLEFQLKTYDDDALLSITKGYPVSTDRADIPFEYSPGEFPYNIMSVVDTTSWGYIASEPVDIFRTGRGWFELTYSYYTNDANNSILSKQSIVTIGIINDAKRVTGRTLLQDRNKQ